MANIKLPASCGRISTEELEALTGGWRLFFREVKPFTSSSSSFSVSWSGAGLSSGIADYYKETEGIYEGTTFKGYTNNNMGLRVFGWIVKNLSLSYNIKFS